MTTPHDLLADAAIDLADLCAQDSSKTEQLIRALLLDEDWCQVRVEFLRAIGVGAADLQVPAAPPGDFSRKLALLRAPGLGPALDTGLLTAECLVALTADPDALEQAWSILAGDDDLPTASGLVRTMDQPLTTGTPQSGAVADTGYGGETRAESWTRLMKSDWPTFRKQIEPWLPVLLQQAGLEVFLSGTVLEWIERRRSELRPETGRRLRDCWSEWIAAFAREELGREIALRAIDPQAFAHMLERRAVELALEGREPFSPAPREPTWVAAFREAGRVSQQSSPLSTNDLMSITLSRELVAPGAIASYRRTLVRQIEQAVQMTDAWI